MDRIADDRQELFCVCDLYFDPCPLCGRDYCCVIRTESLLGLCESCAAKLPAFAARVLDRDFGPPHARRARQANRQDGRGTQR